MNFGVHMDPNRVHMEAEGRPNGGLGAKPPEKGPLGPIGPYWPPLAPIGPKSCRSLTEKVFKNPMYIPVRCDHISQIDIGIFDDAGKRIPFIMDTMTSLRLHFRQK